MKNTLYVSLLLILGALIFMSCLDNKKTHELEGLWEYTHFEIAFVDSVSAIKKDSILACLKETHIERKSRLLIRDYKLRISNDWGGEIVFDKEDEGGYDIYPIVGFDPIQNLENVNTDTLYYYALSNTKPNCFELVDNNNLRLYINTWFSLEKHSPRWIYIYYFKRLNDKTPIKEMKIVYQE